MQIIRLQYISNLRKSQSSISAAWKWKRQLWKETHTDSTVVHTNKAITLSCQNRDLDHARQLFDEMPQRTVVSWNTMITGYYKWNLTTNALGLISLMHHSDVKLNETTFSVSLSVCGRALSLTNGKQLHGLVLKSGYERCKLVGSGLMYLYANSRRISDARKLFDELHEENDLLWSLMLVGYVECDSMAEAEAIFHQMPWRGVVEWTTFISGHVRSEAGCGKALEAFKMMIDGGEADPNEFTLDCVVRGCGKMCDLMNGRVIHGLVVKLGFEDECSICSALVFLYCSCEYVDDAMDVWRYMSCKSVRDSNELIKAYARCGRVEDSKRLFMETPLEILSSTNTMISVYARNGEVEKALDLFEKAKLEGSPISWNSMMSGYIHNDHHEKALDLYLTMCRSSISPTASTFSVLLHACACMGSLQQGRVVHGHLAKTPFSSYVCAGTALIDMYSKCGSIAGARDAFSCISSPNVAAWTALINGHAHHGLGPDAVSSFGLMLERGVTPNAATFVAILSACARAGMFDDGVAIFRSMKEEYGVTPTREHLTCVVELLGRSGLVREAEEFAESMPVAADKIVLTTLLHASWSWMETEVAERAAWRLRALDANSAAACVIMSNVYSGTGKWGKKAEAREAREALKRRGVTKDPGCSWIDISSRSHVFSVGCRNHQNSDMIYATLESLRLNGSSNQD
ncbi:putative pentatricopeptide repeat-containing protein At3g25970 [Salvia splendens]|uniref:putative pentatricopeptide repeat-containing protein At3g25970 n=1 Tax=Salvia splendens TaxID=180675 RepID=UPI001C26C0E6|nr:putative pentatricopeptide repeat-containing protein At3g25970 [Salvia splendens]